MKLYQNNYNNSKLDLNFFIQLSKNNSFMSISIRCNDIAFGKGKQFEITRFLVQHIRFKLLPWSLIVLGWLLAIEALGTHFIGLTHGGPRTKVFSFVHFFEFSFWIIFFFIGPRSCI